MSNSTETGERSTAPPQRPVICRNKRWGPPGNYDFSNGGTSRGYLSNYSRSATIAPTPSAKCTVRVAGVSCHTNRVKRYTETVRQLCPYDALNFLTTAVFGKNPETIGDFSNANWKRRSVESLDIAMRFWGLFPIRITPLLFSSYFANYVQRR